MVKIKKKIISITIFIIVLNIIFSNFIVWGDDEIEEDNTEDANSIINEVSNNQNINPVINSRKYIIFDRETKKKLYGKNENCKCAMASTTKIMTAIVVLEKCEDLNKTICITQKAASTGGSRLGLKKNDKITINDLLYGLLMRSGNDAAVALAIEMAENVENFSNLMNEKAFDLGLKNTHFITPHGLDNPNHYTTTYELAKLTDYALNNKEFRKIVGTKKYTITINGYPKELNNTNELLGILNGVVGVKTGFTNNAGRCLVTETKRNDRDIIVVVLGADTKKDRTKDSTELIEYGFKNYRKFNLEEEIIEQFNNWNSINANRFYIDKGKEQKISMKLGSIKNKILYLNDNVDKINYSFNVITKFIAPLEKNKKIGTLSIKDNDEIIENVDILNSKEIYKKNVLDYFIENLKCITKIMNNIKQ